jgi:hypothetical protein
MLRDVWRLLNVGAVGTMPDAHLLDWFVFRRDEPAELESGSDRIQFGDGGSGDTILNCGRLLTMVSSEPRGERPGAEFSMLSPEPQERPIRIWRCAAIRVTSSSTPRSWKTTEHTPQEA